MQDYEDVLDSRLFRERAVISDRIMTDGTIKPELGVTIKLSETPGSIRTEPVDFGADTEQVLEELGYSDQQISDYRERDII